MNLIVCGCDFRWPGTKSVCISAINVWYKQQWPRVFLASVFHADEWHLYYNMVSLLWKVRAARKTFTV